MSDTKKFFHPSGKGGKMITSKGIIVLGPDGSADVTQEQYDHLMRIPANAEYQKSITIQEAIVPTLEEFVKAGYKAEDYEMRFCGFKAGDPLDEKAIQENQTAKLQKELDEKNRLAEEERLRIEAENNKGKEDQLKKEDLEALDIKALKAIAGKRKIQFAKDIKPEELIRLILESQIPK